MDQSSTLMTAQLLFLEAEDSRRPIKLYINSPGGSVSAGLAIYDTMQYISAPVHTFCMGMAASMGSLLLAGGERGHRYALKHGTVMIHRTLSFPASIPPPLPFLISWSVQDDDLAQNHPAAPPAKHRTSPSTPKRSCESGVN